MIKDNQRIVSELHLAFKEAPKSEELEYWNKFYKCDSRKALYTSPTRGVLRCFSLTSERIRNGLHRFFTGLLREYGDTN